MTVVESSLQARTDSLKLRLHAVTYAAADVLFFELRSPNGEVLPVFTAGAHIDVYMSTGISRSYSLLNDPAERHRYVVGIKLDPSSRGGSAWMHGFARVGAIFEIGRPRNNFELNEAAACSILIAGGIGITPLWSMIQRLDSLNRPWKLHYQARSKAAAPLIDQLTQSRYAQNVTLGFDDEPAQGALNIARIVQQAPIDAHFYCCGPAPMLKAYEAACAELDPSRVHLEYFAAQQLPSLAGGFQVRLARTGKVIAIAPGETILDRLLASGIQVPSSCRQGVCGVCETKVLAGVPDHRDVVLSEAEKRDGTSMIVCCSGALSDELVLDL